jgi:hypothetical protein
MSHSLRGSVAAVFLVASGAVALAALPAQADDHWWHDDMHHFHEHDMGVWRAGHWFHGVHGGRPGWWWIVGGVWYFYPAPVYPYPDPYTPPVAVAPAPPSYYWCAQPPGYYPQVATCLVPWQAVPAATAPSAAPPVAAPPPVPQPPPAGAVAAPPNAAPPPQ